MKITHASSLETLLPQAIIPALALLPMKMDSRPARVELLAIKLQESGFGMARQQVCGPARGLWQFEQGGGVKGVLTHPTSCGVAVEVCKARGVAPSEPAVYAALDQDDILAAAFARLLLWTDPYPLPSDSGGAWDLYSRVWRPGQPHPDVWPTNYQQARLLAGAVCKS